MMENTKKKFVVQKIIRRSLRIVQLRTTLAVLRKSRYILATIDANIGSRKYIDTIIDEVESNITELSYWNAKDINSLISISDLAKSAGIKSFSRFWLSTSDLKYGYTILDGDKDSVILIVCPNEKTFLYEAGDFVKSTEHAKIHSELTSCLRKSDISIIDFGKLTKTRSHV